MIIDTFLFFNEIDMLKARLDYLGSSVDKFIIVESTIDFSSKKRDLLLTEVLLKTLPYNEKVTVVVWDPSVLYKNYVFPIANKLGIRKILLQIQLMQRDCIGSVLGEYNENDLILFSDLDEIPNLDSFKSAIPKALGSEYGIGVFEQDMYYYNTRTLVCRQWRGTAICNVATFRKLGGKCIRKNINKYIFVGDGWHFSYFASPADIKKKIDAIATVENLDYAKKLDLDLIKMSLVKGSDLYGRKGVSFEILSQPIVPSQILQVLRKYFSHA